MRITIMALGGFAGLLLHDLTSLPMRLGVVISSGDRPHEAMGSLVLFALWMLATALVYTAPGVACWLFALAGGVGLYDGITYDIEGFTLWGSAAVVLAALASLARREKREADLTAWARQQHELAVHAALRSLHQSVPELLSHPPTPHERDGRAGNLIELRTERHGNRDAASG